jgi:hypothetical protein
MRYDLHCNDCLGAIDLEIKTCFLAVTTVRCMRCDGLARQKQCYENDDSRTHSCLQLIYFAS